MPPTAPVADLETRLAVMFMKMQGPCPRRGGGKGSGLNEKGGDSSA
jgi:hypothetical protein